MASAPLPESGLNRISFVSSLGTPKKSKSGLSVLTTKSESPLFSNSSLATITAKIYGKIDKSNSIALLTPVIKELYTSTFLKKAHKKANNIKMGKIYTEILIFFYKFFLFYLLKGAKKTPHVVEKIVQIRQGRMIFSAVKEP